MPVGARPAATTALTPAKNWRGPASYLSLGVNPIAAPRTIRISRLSHTHSHQPPTLQIQRTRHSLTYSPPFISHFSPLTRRLINFPPTKAPAVRRPHTTTSPSLNMAPTREWTAQEVRDTFLKFFEERGHTFGESDASNTTCRPVHLPTVLHFSSYFG